MGAAGRPPSECRRAVALVNHAFAHLLARYGYSAVIVFFIAEGVGVPFPAETMLVTAAAFAARGRLSFAAVLVAASAGGIAGGSAGYWIGRVGGLRLVTRFGRLVRLDEQKLTRAQEFFRERGGRAAFLCRFLAFLRIVIPMLIGLSSMSFARFSVFNAAGSIAAAVVYGTLGYTFGKDLPTLLHHVALVSVVVATIALAAAGVYLWRRRTVDAPSTMSRPESDG